MLRPGNERAFERILLYGAESTGKTYAWLKVAKWAQKTKSESRFYVIDTDNAVGRMMADDEFANLTNVDWHVPTDWIELLDYTAAYVDKVGPGDWLVVDMASWAWEAVQQFYTKMRFGSDLGSFKLQAAVSGGSPNNPFDGDTDWSTINSLYREWSGKLVRLQGHLLLTSSARPVSSRDNADLKDRYQKYGSRPEGQKHLGHLAHTVVQVTCQGDTYRMTAVKDRSREKMEGVEVSDFCRQYLMGVAGWRL